MPALRPKFTTEHLPLMTHHPHQRFRVYAGLTAVTLSACFGAAWGQSKSDNSREAPSQAPQDTPRRVDSEVLGVSVGIPDGAIAEHFSQGETSRIRIREASSPPKWALTIRSLGIPQGEQSISPLEMARIFIADARTISPKLVVLDEEPTNIHQRPAARIAAEIPSQEGDKRARYDWLVRQAGGGAWPWEEQRRCS